MTGFQAMIQRAQAELDSLPTERLPFKQHKRRERTRRATEAEVKHCEQLTLYGLEGIEIRRAEENKC